MASILGGPCASFRKEARAWGAKGIAAKSRPLTSVQTPPTSFLNLLLATAVLEDDQKENILFGHIVAPNNIVGEEGASGYLLGN